MDYYEISNKEKIESQLFGDGISEEEVINELSQKLEEIPTTENLVTNNIVEDNSQDVSDIVEPSENASEITESIDIIKPE